MRESHVFVAAEHISYTSHLPCIWLWFSSRERMIRLLKQLSEKRLLFLPLCCQTWEWYLDALLSAPNSVSGWIPYSECLVYTRVAPVLPHCCSSMNNLDKTGLYDGMTHCPVSYQRCSLREGARIPATQRKILMWSNFQKLDWIFLGTEKPVGSCSKVKKLCLESLKAVDSRNCHSGLEAEFIYTGEGGHNLAWMLACTLWKYFVS